MPEVVVTHLRLVGHIDLRSRQSELIAVDNRPKRLVMPRPLAGKDAIAQNGNKGFPVRTFEQLPERPLNRGDPSQRLGVAVVNRVPNAPDIFPTFVACAIEKGVLQIVHFVARPAVADVHHITRLKPFILADRRLKSIFPIAPYSVVPGNRRIVIAAVAALGLEDNRVTGLIRSGAESQRNGAHSVAIDSISSNRGHQMREGLPVGATFGARSLIPRVVGKQHADAMAVKVLNHLPQARDSARHVTNQVKLIAIVNSDVGIGWPDEHGVDAAIALVEIIQVTLDGVPARLWIVEISVVRHHLRLDESLLRPSQFRAVILHAVVADTNPMLHPPVTNIL